MGAVMSLFHMNATDYTRWVDPLIGSGGHGHVFVGASTPFGLVTAGPTQLGSGWDWCSGYHYSDSTIVGFGQLHLSGTGCADLGDVMLMPVTQGYKMEESRMEDKQSGVYSTFSHQDECARPGYYSVWLKRYKVKAEITATPRVAFYKFTFPDKASKHLAVDLVKAVGGNRMTRCGMTKADANTITGFRASRGWARSRTLYFAIQTSQPITQWDTEFADKNSKDAQGYALATFDEREGTEVYVKVGLSAVSEEGALGSIKGELPGWDFEQAVSNARDSWNAQLGKIDAQFSTEAEQRVFYTSFYHTMIAPTLFCDLDGRYRGTDGQVHSTQQIPNYTTFSLWDTYRGAHPLATLVHPELQESWAYSMLRIYQQQGYLPVWPLMANETNCMVGSPAVPVLADLYLKGIVRDTLFYEAMKQTMLSDVRSLDHLKQYGYIPCDKDNESVSKNLENYLADWSLAQVATLLHKKEDARYFSGRSKGYRLIYDAEKQFFRGKDSKGAFREEKDFNPCHQTQDYTEGTPWQYLWLVPHDVKGLIKTLGGKKSFEQRLDSLFLASSDLGLSHNPDISGLVGQYAHGNEPSHHVCYLYNYVGRPDKTAARVREMMQTFYRDTPDGICGNEDVGQMSAWYVLSAMGFYPVEPCGGIYQIGSPSLQSANINVGNGKTLRIVTYGNDADSPYVQKIKMNKKKYSRTYFHHKDLVKGGLIEIYMGKKPASY